MKSAIRRITISILLATGLILNSARALEDSTRTIRQEILTERVFCKQVLKGDLFARIELFFGLSRPGGSITEEEFQNFINTEVTPLFPDGLTLLTGVGQFRDSTGTILSEGSKVLLLLYPFNQENHQAIEAIRQAYINAFQQQSVLRVDEQSCVSF